MKRDKIILFYFNLIVLNILFFSVLDRKCDLVNNWKYFKLVWKNYEIVIRLYEKDDKLWCVIFLICMGLDVFCVFDGLKFLNVVDRENMDVVIKVMEEFCVG